MAPNNFEKVCRKIVGAGANYWNFIQQTGSVKPDQPVIFFKPQSSLITATGDPKKDVILVSIKQLHYKSALNLFSLSDSKSIQSNQL